MLCCSVSFMISLLERNNACTGFNPRRVPSRCEYDWTNVIVRRRSKVILSYKATQTQNQLPISCIVLTSTNIISLSGIVHFYVSMFSHFVQRVNIIHISLFHDMNCLMCVHKLCVLQVTLRIQNCFMCFAC